MIPELKKNCTTKFDESLDLSFQINNKQKKSEVNIRTVVNLPGGTGKKVKVAVLRIKGMEYIVFELLLGKSFFNNLFIPG